MSNLRDAAQRALEAIERALPYAPHRGEFDALADAADDLQAALAEPEQPVGINGLTEAETTASASVTGLVGKSVQENKA